MQAELDAYQKLTLKTKRLKREIYNETVCPTTASLSKELLWVGAFKLNTTKEEHGKELYFSLLLNRANVQIQSRKTNAPTSLTVASSCKKSEFSPSFWDVCIAQVKQLKKNKNASTDTVATSVLACMIDKNLEMLEHKKLHTCFSLKTESTIPCKSHQWVGNELLKRPSIGL